ncbi:MAG TPA: sugar phosphate isomerase/epimerase family protein [Candidatus Limnocylindrales bacterium]|jgi:sugar phosphate isomerase/epimerase|nr:sugar phosphate isomerase/epimerase family protein [Candidatus Limnocylindrales bacterium]
MNASNRRDFIRTAALSGLAGGALLQTLCTLHGAEAKPRKMTMDLTCGSIGIAANQHEAIELAAKHGFESVSADGGYLASLSDDQLAEVKTLMRNKNLAFGSAGLPVEFRLDENRFRESLKELPRFATGLKRAGVSRTATWLSPADARLTYLQNFRQHATRLREVAKVLQEQEVRLGLEYVGPKTAWSARLYPFVHTMAELRELIAEINLSNVGLVLDSWHWWHAGDKPSDILALNGRDVIAVDLNDAPGSIPKDQQLDNHRELPCATGRIDVATFLRCLNQIGYDGPVRAEPFNEAVNKMSKDEACAAAAAALRKAVGLIG